MKDKSVHLIPPSAKSVNEANNHSEKRKVAAYARVSTEHEEQHSSYEAQIDYYSSLIKNNPNWEFAGVYSDEGITATSTSKRDGFNKMVQDAMEGKFSLIITKSISRFARNTVDSLVTTRLLKENGVEFKMGRASLKPHTIDNIVKLYEMGKSTQQIVKELKLSKSSVEKYIREYKKGVGIEIGTQKFKGTHYRKANETSKLYISDYVKGISVNEIAKKYGVSRQRVYQAIKSSKKGKKEWEKIKSK